jgi:hypothetical protein
VFARFLNGLNNFAFWVGILVLAMGSGPLLLFGFLQDKGLVAPGNNGLGFGLLMFFTFIFGALFVAGGIIEAFIRAVSREPAA